MSIQVNIEVKEDRQEEARCKKTTGVTPRVY